MSSSRDNIFATNIFGRGSLAITEACAMYMARYCVPPDMRMPSSGWKMVINRIDAPLAPTSLTGPWRDEIRLSGAA
jgi:hypothetical protein